MKKRDLDELFEEFYKDENEMLMNLFCASLISSECLENEQDCLMHMEKLQAFKKFIEQQPDSEKKRNKVAFIKNAEAILNKDLEHFRR